MAETIRLDLRRPFEGLIRLGPSQLCLYLAKKALWGERAMVDRKGVSNRETIDHVKVFYWVGLGCPRTCWAVLEGGVRRV